DGLPLRGHGVMRRRGMDWSGERPPWWPRSEQWPPRRGRGPARVVRRMFVGFLVFLFLVNAAILVVALQVAHLFGLVEVPPNVALLSSASAFLFLLILAIAMGVAFTAFRRTAAPLHSALEAVEKVAAGDYTARASERGPRDLRRLATSFNTMVA